MEQLKSILTSREALYGKALAQFDTSGLSEDEAFARLKDLVLDRGFLST